MRKDHADGVEPLRRAAVSAEVIAFGAERVLRALDGHFNESRGDERLFMRQDGAVVDGSADPELVPLRGSGR
ncbi:hypothetical protein [Mycobacterium sp. C31M]